MSAYDVGFAESYQGDKPNTDRFDKEDAIDYTLGREDGEKFFGKVTEIMEVTDRSLREVHVFAINRLYDDIKEHLEKEDT
jgi:hypothetical protein